MVVLGIILLVVAFILGCVVGTRSPQYRRGGRYHSLSPVIAIFAIAALVGAIYFLLPDDGTAKADGNQSSTSSTSKTTASKKSGEVKVSQALIDALTVRTVNVDCSQIVSDFGGSTVASSGKTVVKYDIASLKGSPPRPWTDSPSTAFVNKDPQQILKELQANFCWDPELGGMWANFFANMTVDNVSVVNLNPWLQAFAGDPTLVNQTVSRSYVALQDVDHPSKLQVRMAAVQNIEWQKTAEKLGTLLVRFNLIGQQNPRSVFNLHLALDGATVGGLPAIGVNPLQENWPALVLQLTNKGACAPTKLIGINLFDKRPEEFALPTCASSPPSPAPHAPASTPPHHGGGSGTPTTTRPGCNTCTTTTTIPECGRKCHVTTTTSTPPTTTPGSGNTPPYHPPTGNGSGTGAPTTQQTTPTTVAQPATPPPTAAGPVTRVSD